MGFFFNPDSRFSEIEVLRPTLNVFSNPLQCDIKSQIHDIQMELCNLRNDFCLLQTNLNGIELWKIIDSDKYPKFKDSALYYICLWKHIYNTFSCNACIYTYAGTEF